MLFQSQRLLFRQFTPADADLIYELNREPEVLRYLHEPVTTPENAPAIISEIILPQYQRGLGRWAVHLKYSQEFIGWCGLKYLEHSKEIDLGYRLLKAHWGKGYATEAASTCISYAFAHLKVSAVVARAHVDNLASLRVIEKCGMKFLRKEIVDGCPVKTFGLLNQCGNFST